MISPFIASSLPSSVIQLGSQLQQAQGRFATDAFQTYQPFNMPYGAVSNSGIAAIGNEHKAMQAISRNTFATNTDVNSPAETGGVNFKQVLASTIGQVNQTVQQPDMLLKQLMSGGNVDIHDVVMANTKAELAVTLTSQVLTKIVQAYDRVSQIQV